MCQNCGPYRNGRIKEWVGNHANVIRELNPSFILWHHELSIDSFSRWTRSLRSSPHLLGVSYWMLFQNTKGLCLEQGSTER